MARGAAYQSTRLTHCLFARFVTSFHCNTNQGHTIGEAKSFYRYTFGWSIPLANQPKVLKYIIKERFRNIVRVKARTVSRQGASNLSYAAQNVGHWLNND